MSAMLQKFLPLGRRLEKSQAPVIRGGALMTRVSADFN